MWTAPEYLFMSDKPAKTRKKAAPAEAGSPPPAKQGRPSSFTQEVGDHICELMANGDSLRDICLLDNMPNRSTVARWLAASTQFRDQYAHACEMRQEELFDQIIDIADTPQIGTKSVSKASGIEISEGDMIEHRRLQVEARKWALGKMAPKKYGDKQTTELTGADGGPIKVQTAAALTDDQLAAIAAGKPCN